MFYIFWWSHKENHEGLHLMKEVIWASNLKLSWQNRKDTWLPLVSSEHKRIWITHILGLFFPPTQGNQEECTNQSASFLLATKYSHLSNGKDLGHHFLNDCQEMRNSVWAQITASAIPSSPVPVASTTEPVCRQKIQISVCWGEAFITQQHPLWLHKQDKSPLLGQDFLMSL